MLSLIPVDRSGYTSTSESLDGAAANPGQPNHCASRVVGQRRRGRRPAIPRGAGALCGVRLTWRGTSNARAPRTSRRSESISGNWNRTSASASAGSKDCATAASPNVAARDKVDDSAAEAMWLQARGEAVRDEIDVIIADLQQLPGKLLRDLQTTAALFRQKPAEFQSIDEELAALEENADRPADRCLSRPAECRCSARDSRPARGIVQRYSRIVAGPSPRQSRKRDALARRARSCRSASDRQSQSLRLDECPSGPGR